MEMDAARRIWLAIDRKQKIKKNKKIIIPSGEPSEDAVSESVLNDAAAHERFLVGTIPPGDL